MAEISKLSDADLAAVAAGDFSKVSDAGLAILAGQTPPKFQHGAVDSMLQGATFGFSDELGAAKDAAFGQGTYSENLRDRALSRAQYERANPVQAFGAEMGGAAGMALVPGLGAYRAATAPAIAARLGPNAARYIGSAAGGAVSGAVTGAGTAPEGERMQGAVRGGVTGAIAGPAVTGTFQAAGKAGGLVRDVTAGMPVAQRVGQAAAVVTGGTANFEERAREKLLQAFNRDRMSPQDIAYAGQILGDKPETLVERAGGRNVLGLADVATKYPGAARAMAGELADERMGGQLSRISDDLGKAFRVQGDPMALAQSFSAKRSAEARPLYEKAYQEGAALADPRINEYMALPAFQRAYGVARRLAKYDGVELPADPRKVSQFDLRTLDYVKRGLDDVLYTGKVKGSIGGTERTKILEAQQGFLGTLDELVPTYQQARAAWAGPTAMKEALEAGADITKMSASQLQQTIGRMAPAEMEQFKIGALGAIRENMRKASDGRDLVKQVYGSPDKRDILRALVGEDQFADLEQRFMREKAIRRTDDTIRGNSKTAERTAGMADLEADTTVLNSVMQRGPLRGPLEYMLRSGTGVAQPTADALAPMLFSTNPKMQQQTLQQLIDLDRVMRQRAAGRGTFGGTAAGGGAGLLGDQGN